MSTALLENTETTATAARLERLAARRAEQAAPVAPTAKGTKAAAKGRKGAPTNDTKITALIASIATTGGLAFLLAPAGGTTTATPTVAAATPVALQSSSAGTATAATTAAAAATGTAKTITGAAENNRFGTVQVSATFSSTGALTAVTLLQQPGDNHSIRINQSAVPTLTNEALAAQSANINSVSGATYTSNSYVASLQAAIDTARAQGITTLV